MYKNYRTNKMAAPKGKATVQDLLGEKLTGKDGTVEVRSLFGPGKVIGLYFSAHWCLPCRGFTPTLAEFYNDFKQKNPSKNFEIVFASSDRDEASFNEYFSEMPWLALPYQARNEKAKLSKKFKVQGIPTLVILDGETEEIITKNGREKVSSDKDGSQFPWRPKPFSDVIGGPLVNKDGKETTASEAFKGKHVGVYFSAHWCPPCRGFTPQLATSYNKINENEKKFEVIFVSRDSTEEEFKEYLNEMPWLAIPYGDPRIEALNEIFEISGIPDLKILDENGKVVCANGRGRVGGDSEGKEFPWPKKSVEVIEESVEHINQDICLILFTDEDDKKCPHSKELLKDCADKEFAQGDGQDLFFAVAKNGEELTNNLKEFFKISKDCRLVVTNIEENGIWEFGDSEITKEVVADVVAKHHANKLDFKKIKQ